MRLEVGDEVRVSSEYASPVIRGFIKDTRGVGISEQTESTEYLVESKLSSLTVAWIPERYLTPILYRFEVFAGDKEYPELQRSLFYKAENFAHAEEQAEQDFDLSQEIIVKIVKEY